MKIGGYLALLLYISVPICISTALKEDEIDYEDGPAHIVVPRSIRVFSKGPDPDSPRYAGPRISKHLHNVIQGGTVGMEFDVKEGMGRFGPLWDKIRKFFPKYRDNKGLDFVPADEVKSEKDAEILDPVGRGLINPRIKPSPREDHLEEVDWERV